MSTESCHLIKVDSKSKLVDQKEPALLLMLHSANNDLVNRLTGGFLSLSSSIGFDEGSRSSGDMACHTFLGKEGRLRKLLFFRWLVCVTSVLVALSRFVHNSR